MAYRPQLLEFTKIRNMNLGKGKDTILLAKKNNRLYRVEEYIGIIVKSYPKHHGCIESQDVMFQNRKVFNIMAYRDNIIKEGDFVSIYGIFTPKDNGELEFTCIGGMQKVFESPKDLGYIDKKYMYRFGIAELSRVKVSTRYPLGLKGLEVLDTNILWTYSSSNLEKIEEKFEEILKREDTLFNAYVSWNDFISKSNPLEE